MAYIITEPCIGVKDASCPVEAIKFEDDVAEDQRQYIAINRQFFRDVPASERVFRPRTERTSS
jgi:hypothetical protein